jgi:hypothetical protein
MPVSLSVVVPVKDEAGNAGPLAREIAAALKGGDGLGMVSGVRAKRRDNFSRRVASSLANGFRRRALKDTAVDSGCGIKAFRREAFLALPYFDHQHRFMTTLMLREGYGVGFADVNHRPRLHGRSKYTNLQRMFAGIYDILGVRWLQARTKPDPEPTEL